MSDSKHCKEEVTSCATVFLLLKIEQAIFYLLIMCSQPYLFKLCFAFIFLNVKPKFIKASPPVAKLFHFCHISFPVNVNRTE